MKCYRRSRIKCRYLYHQPERLVREKSVGENQIVEELEEKTKDLGAVVEFLNHPAVPGYGSSDGFSLRLLDKEQYDQLPGVR